MSLDFGNDMSKIRGLETKIRNMGVDVLGQFILAGCSHYDAALEEMGQICWPLTWIHGDASKNGKMNSTQLIGISGIETREVIMDGKIIGRTFENEYARYCRLAGILPQDKFATREEQSLSVFNRIREALNSVDMDFTNVVRTWLYLDDLLKWYDSFNKVRTDFFSDWGVFDRLVPASTGIGAANPYGAALLADVLAVVPKNNSCKIQAIPSPLQCPAITYKSSFSRAVEISFPTHRQLYVSGTASIFPDGKSAHIGDPVKQVELTMKVVEAILTSREMSWNDITRGIVYLKEMHYLPVFTKYCLEHSISLFPLAISHADICRDELLFEIEVDAVRRV